MGGDMKKALFVGAMLAATAGTARAQDGAGVKAAEENLEAAAEAVAAEATAGGTQEEAEPPPTARKAPEGFAPVSGPAPAQEELKAPPLVVAAYLFIWLGTFVYLLLLWRRQRRIAEEVADLEARLSRKEA